MHNLRYPNTFFGVGGAGKITKCLSEQLIWEQGFELSAFRIRSMNATQSSESYCCILRPCFLLPPSELFQCQERICQSVIPSYIYLLCHAVQTNPLSVIYCLLMTRSESNYWMHDVEVKLWNTQLLHETPGPCDVICVSDWMVKQQFDAYMLKTRVRVRTSDYLTHLHEMKCGICNSVSWSVGRLAAVPTTPTPSPCFPLMTPREGPCGRGTLSAHSCHNSTLRGVTQL